MAAIQQWRAGTPAMADRRRARTRWRLGFRFEGDAERVRGGKAQERGEERRGHLILARGGSGGTASSSRGGGATARVGGTEVEGDRVAFARNPLESSLVFAGRSFSLLFLFSFYFFSVFDLIRLSNELQIL